MKRLGFKSLLVTASLVTSGVAALAQTMQSTAPTTVAGCVETMRDKPLNNEFRETARRCFHGAYDLPIMNVNAADTYTSAKAAAAQRNALIQEAAKNVGMDPERIEGLQMAALGAAGDIFTDRSIEAQRKFEKSLDWIDPAQKYLKNHL